MSEQTQRELSIPFSLSNPWKFPLHGLFAMWYRHIILFLKYADDVGMIDDDHCTLVW